MLDGIEGDRPVCTTGNKRQITTTQSGYPRVVYKTLRGLPQDTPRRRVIFLAADRGLVVCYIADSNADERDNVKDPEAWCAWSEVYCINPGLEDLEFNQGVGMGGCTGCR